VVIFEKCYKIALTPDPSPRLGRGEKEAEEVSR
jgi:hypothetical protein